jgi:hypothetical protein
MRKISIHKICLCFIIVCMPSIFAFASAGFGEDVEDVPIDGGLSLLVAAGVGYGAKKLKGKK